MVSAIRAQLTAAIGCSIAPLDKPRRCIADADCNDDICDLATLRARRMIFSTGSIPKRQRVQIGDGMLLIDFFQSQPIRFYCLKYFPVGFMVTWDIDDRGRVRLPNLRDYMLLSCGHQVDLPIPLCGLPLPRWPEAPTSKGMVVYGQDAMGALPRIKPRQGTGGSA